MPRPFVPSPDAPLGDGTTNHGDLVKMKRFSAIALCLVIVFVTASIAVSYRVPSGADAKESFKIYTEFETQAKALGTGAPPKFFSPRKDATVLIFDLAPGAKVLEANEKIKNAIAPLHPGRRIILKYAPNAG